MTLTFSVSFTVMCPFSLMISLNRRLRSHLRLGLRVRVLFVCVSVFVYNSFACSLRFGLRLCGFSRFQLRARFDLWLHLVVVLVFVNVFVCVAVSVDVLVCVPLSFTCLFTCLASLTFPIE